MGVRDDGIKKCRVCGKKFYPVCPEIWAYKKIKWNERKWYCSWGCMRSDTFKPQKKFKHEPETRRTSHNGKAVVAIDAKTGELFAEFPSMLCASNAFDLNAPTSIKKRIATGKAYGGYIFKYKKDYEEGR